MGKVLQKATAVFAAVILLASSIGFAGGSGLFANALGEYLDPFDYLFDDNIIGVTDIDAYSYDSYVLDSLENYYDFYKDDDLYHNDGPDIEFDDSIYSIVAVESSDPSVVEVGDYETGGYVLRACDQGSAIITVYHYGEVYNQKPSDDQIYLGNYDTFQINVERVPESEVVVSKIADKNYTGKYIKPALKLTYRDMTLVEGRDYTAYFDGNREVGTASVEILLSGGFTGTIYDEFRILPTISKTSAVLYYGTKLNLKVNTSEKVIWKTKNKSVAKVSSSGVVTPVSAGTAVITATTGGYTLSCKVTVKKRQLNASKKTLYIGQRFDLDYYGGTGTVKWKSSNSKIAKVNKNGLVTALKKGKVTITATRNNRSVTCTVNVIQQKLSSSKLTVKAGKTADLDLKGAVSKVTWTSSKPKIASVNKNGLVKGLKKGTAVITAKHAGVSYKCTVTVK